MRDGFAAIRSRHDTTSSVRALVLVSRDTGELRNLFQAGPQNFLGELIQIAGGTHAVAGGAAVTKEQIILANPHVIIDLSGGESAKSETAAAAALHVWDSLSTVDAVKNHRVHVLADPHALVPGPYLVNVAEKFEQLLHE
jgi:ABC-type Fe3+-hydroxamate transport system substrate-binding protein